MIGRHAFILLAILSLATGPARGSPLHEVSLVPGSSTVAIRTYGLGLLPFDGRFARFQGVLRYDGDDHARCSVALRIDAASLAMSSAAMTATVLGTGLLDAAHYPTLAYDGACGPDGIAGTLMMHGVTRPLGLKLDWDGGALTAVGRLRRAEWGMTGLPLVGGSTVRIKVTVALAGRR